MTPPEKPQVIYDGECGICSEWVAHWRQLTGAEIEYRPFQQAADDYPEIGWQALRHSIYFIDTDGSHVAGAGAAFRIYRGKDVRGLLYWCYTHLPGFAPASELIYRFFANHRGLLAFLTNLLWGRNFRPPRYEVTRWLFLRFLGFIYLGAMASFSVQALQLIGSDGILPLENHIADLRATLGERPWLHVPMLFWFNQGDAFIQWLPIAGCLAAIAVVFNFATRTSLILLYVIYLSLFYAGQTFMTYQWDLELLEAGVLAILLTSESRVALWLLRWLVFRFMFMSGFVKLASGDLHWRNLTALDYHFETQPLPTPLAWYAHHLPEWMLKSGSGATLVIELLLPFLVFMPRRPRMLAGCAFILLQFAIILTGNYNFFNLLTICLCLALFDDRALSRFVPSALVSRLQARRARHPISRLVTWVLAPLIVITSSNLLLTQMGVTSHYWALTRAVSVCQCVNNYGPFAVMTTRRFEIVIEGSNDGMTWKAYDFRYKPGDVSRMPAWIIPHQPRVDWQLWFAALDPGQQPVWFRHLVVRLLQGDPAMDSLFHANPFPDRPPAYLRALYYRYQFTTPAERAATGHWWKRNYEGQYLPPVKLQPSRQVGE